MLKEKPVTRTIARKLASEKAIAASFAVAIKKARQFGTGLIVQRDDTIREITPATAARLLNRAR